MSPTHRSRVSFLVLAVSLLAVGIVYRLVDLQVVRREPLRQRAVVQHVERHEVAARRGAILDRRGRDLAISVPTHSLYVAPARVGDPAAAARRLGPVLGMDVSTVHRRLTVDRKRYRVKRGLAAETVRALLDLDLLHGDPPAFYLEPETSRVYPYDNLAAHVVGFAGVDQTGLAGVELARHRDLQGAPAYERAVIDGLGHRLVDETLPPAKTHNDVVLTLDLVLQHAVERELERAIRETASRAGVVILLEPGTGEVLAMASRPAPSLTRYPRSNPESRRNRATYDTFEPGSTFKVVVAAAALDAGAVSSTTRFDCEQGRYRVADRWFRDLRPFDVLSVRAILENSSNVGMIKIGRRVDGAALEDYVRRFGFGRRTGIEIAESNGTVPDLRRASEVELASLSIGYGVSTTALQLVSAISALGNDGVLAPPRIVLGLRDPDGRWRPDRAPEPRRVVSQRTARTLASILEGVVERGTGKEARVPGYRVAGKTGTARKHVQGRGYTDDHVASFVGFAPVGRPRLACLVVLDCPRRGSHYGGRTAAPVFARIMSNALAYLRVPPADARTVVYPNGPDRQRSATLTAGAGR